MLWLRAFEGSEADEMSGANAVLTQRVVGTFVLTYELSVWHKVETNYISASTLLAMDFLDASGEILLTESLELNGQHPADGSWVKYSVRGKAPEGTEEVQARAEMVNGVNANTNPQSAMVDDFFLTTIEAAEIASVTGFDRGAAVLRIFAEDAEGSAVVADTDVVTIDGESVMVLASKAAKITTLTHIPTTPWDPGARLEWTFQAEDDQGDAILGEGTLRVPGSLIFGGGTVTTRHVLSDLELTDAVVAREALASPLEEVTVETPWAHFDDGALPPMYEDLSAVSAVRCSARWG
ncbi:MAG: hypothetical protein ACI8T1_000167 [Verrucomicrobiales bacterium]